mmetsp:Transcript_26339/g.40253  ORF Transcript_26339/g.40253 Transcript_26339/m.40253 type:complete len:136 (-) Transcript_26339:354-761(-)
MIKPTFIAIVALLFASANAFVTPGASTTSISTASSKSVSPISSTSLDMGRQWNFNEGRGPFGLKKNAEIWNGRVAQMGFTVVLLQELITGKGVVQSWQDGDAIAYIMLGVTVVSVVGISALLTFKGKEDFIPKKQ